MDLKRKKSLHYNSLSMHADQPNHYLDDAKKMAKEIVSLINMKEQQPQDWIDDMMMVQVANSYKQNNAIDCGIYVCKWITDTVFAK
jgi:Ulp1 family protease